jgi:transposase
MTATAFKMSLMAPYPKELRVRVVAAVEEGGFSIPEAARIFQVGMTFIKKMLRLSRAGDPLEPRHGGGPVPLLQEKETTLWRQEIRACPAATLEELQKALADQCQAPASLSTISRSLQGLTLPRKKSLLASERDEKARTKLRTLTHAFAREPLILIDAMGSNLGLTRPYRDPRAICT